jgi:xanthine dehydrogenase accessory factor
VKDVLDDIEKWLSQGHSVALATLVSTIGSSPREPGATLAVNDLGEVVGSISGGCVEGAIVEEALAVIKSGNPQLLIYGVADGLGLSIGLTCGGTIQVFVERLERHCPKRGTSLIDIFRAIREAATTSAMLCTLVGGAQAGSKLVITEDARCIGSLGNPGLDRIVTQDAQDLLAKGRTSLRHYGNTEDYLNTDATVFVESFVPPPHLIIFGAIDFTRSLCQLGKMLGYQTTVCDARSRFATTHRFPEADNIVVEWPNSFLEKTRIDHRTVIAVLTHDPKFDVPALMTAVRTPAAYIGALGSRKTHADRLRRLRAAGISDDGLARINSPIGLDIGAQTPEETAVSIMAEVIALRSGRNGSPLSTNQNPIHARSF